MFKYVKTILKYLFIVFIASCSWTGMTRANVTVTSTSVDVIQQNTPQQGDTSTVTTTTTNTTTTTTVPGYNQNVVSEQTTKTGDVLTNSTFGTGGTYSDDGWTMTGYDSHHGGEAANYGGGNAPGGSWATGLDSKAEQSISVKDDGGLTQAEINNGFKSELSADIWYWHNYGSNTTTMTQTITGASGNVTTQERIISGKNASNTNNIFVNYSDTYINTGNTETDYTIKVTIFNAGTGYHGGHWGPDIDDVELDIEYNEITTQWVAPVTTSNTVITESVSTAVVFCWEKTPSTCPDEGITDITDDIFDDLETVEDTIEERFEEEDAYFDTEIEFFEEEVYVIEDEAFEETFETSIVEEDIEDMFAGVFDGMEMGDIFDFFETDNDMGSVDDLNIEEETFTEMGFEEPPMMEEFEEMSTELYEELDMPMDMFEALPPPPMMETEMDMEMDMYEELPPPPTMIETEVDMDIDETQTTTFQVIGEKPDMETGMDIETEMDMDMDEQPSTMTFESSVGDDEMDMDMDEQPSTMTFESNVASNESEEFDSNESVETEDLVSDASEEMGEEPMVEEKPTTQTFTSMTNEEEVVEEKPTTTEDNLIAEADEVTEEMPTETTEESIESEPIAKSDSVEEEVDSPTEEKEEKSTLISKKESNEEEDKPKDKKSDTTTSKVKVIDKTKTKTTISNAEEQKQQKVELKLDIDKLTEKIEEKVADVNKQLVAVSYIVSEVMVKNQPNITEAYKNRNSRFFDNRQLYKNQSKIYEDNNVMLGEYNYSIYEKENTVLVAMSGEDGMLKYQTNLNNAVNKRQQLERELYILKTKSLKR